jgi:metal-dependent amidase/aminoacylase/carboxypeptidase family protein
MLFSANAIPSDISIEELIEITFGRSPNGMNKAASAAKAIIVAFRSQKVHVLSDKELSQVANNGSFSRGQFYNVIHDMVSLGILRRSEWGEYELSTDFSSALMRIAKAYRNSIQALTTRVSTEK